MSTFLEKFDELIAGKTPGEWTASFYETDFIIRSELANICLAQRVCAHNAEFIAFVGTHAELIRDALKAHVDYFSLRGGYPKSPALVDEKKKAMHAAFEALDNAVLSKSEQRRLAVQRGAKDEAVK